MYLLNTRISEQKNIRSAITTIYGISKALANFLCNELGIGLSFKVDQLTNIQLYKLRKYIKEHLKIGNYLKREEIYDIKRLIEIKSYRGSRHRHGYPVRGQRTHSNARTQKSLSQKRISLLIK